MAECSCSLKKHHKETEPKCSILVELHKKFKQAIIKRFKISSMFAGIESPPCKKEIDIFKSFGMKLLLSTLPFIESVFKNKSNFSLAQELIGLVFDLFN